MSKFAGRPIAGYAETQYQPLSPNLTQISNIVQATNGVIISDGSQFILEQGTTLLASLGIGPFNNLTFNTVQVQSPYTPLGPSYLTSKSYTDATYLQLTGANGPMTGNLDMGTHILYSNYLNSTAGNITIQPAGGGYALYAATPSQTTELTNKAYVDSIAAGLQPRGSAYVKTQAALPAYTYNNGASGVGATLTFGAVIQIDSTVLTSNMIVLVNDETGGSQAYNGVYYVSQTAPVTILTRSTAWDGNPSGELTLGAMIYITAGTSANTSWVLSATVTTVGTDPVIFTQFSALLTAGTGINITSNAINITNTGVTAAAYTFPNITVNAQGQITSATNNTLSSIGAVAKVGDSMTGNLNMTGNSVINISALSGNSLPITVLNDMYLTNQTLFAQEVDIGDAGNVVQFTKQAGGSSYGIAMPNSAPTTGQQLSYFGSQYQWKRREGMEAGVVNCGLALSDPGDGGGITITLTQGDGITAPSTTDPCTVCFRTVPGSGYVGYTPVDISSSISITIPFGTTLGSVVGAQALVFIYCIYENWTTPIMGVCLSALDEDFVENTQNIVGGTSTSTLYTASAIPTYSPIKIIGVMPIIPSISGVWTNPQDIALSSNNRLDNPNGVVNGGTINIFGTDGTLAILGKTTGGSTYNINFPASPPAASTVFQYNGTNYVWGSIAGSTQLVGATESAAGTAGYCPMPAQREQGKYLQGSGAWANIYGSKNRLNNGSMCVNQYGLLTSSVGMATSGTTSTNTALFSVDRMFAAKIGLVSGGFMLWGTCGTSDLPYTDGAAVNYVRVGNGPAGSAINGVVIGQNIESTNVINALAGQEVTLSCYVQCGISANIASVTIALYGGTGQNQSYLSGLTGSALVCTLTVVPSTSWTRISCTGTVGTAVTELSAIMQLNRLAAIAGTTDEYMNVTGFQLELGDTMTTYDAKPYEKELFDCQRYYQTGVYGFYAPSFAGIGNGYQLYYNMKRDTYNGTWNALATSSGALGAANAGDWNTYGLPTKINTILGYSTVTYSGAVSGVNLPNGGAYQVCNIQTEI